MFAFTHANLIASVGAVNIILGHHPIYEDNFLVYVHLAHVLEYMVELIMIFVDIVMQLWKISPS